MLLGLCASSSDLAGSEYPTLARLRRKYGKNEADLNDDARVGKKVFEQDAMAMMFCILRRCFVCNQRSELAKEG